MRALGRTWRKRFDERGLRWLFGAFFLALAVPAALLVAQAYGQLKWEALRTTQLAAEELAARVDAQLKTAIAAEDARSFGDYSFLVVTGDAAANFVQRSPLSAFPVTSVVPGVLGYFQVDAAGRLTTPLLPGTGVAPTSYGIGAEEQAARAARVDELRAVLAQNHLVRAARDETPASPELADKPRLQDSLRRRPAARSRTRSAAAGRGDVCSVEFCIGARRGAGGVRSACVRLTLQGPCIERRGRCRGEEPPPPRKRRRPYANSA